MTMRRFLFTFVFILCILPSTSCAQHPLWKVEEYFEDPQLVALCKAIERDDFDEVERLVKAGTDVNARGKDSMTPLLWGYPMGEKMLEKLLELGGDPNTQYDSDFGTGMLGNIQPGDSLLFLAIKSADPTNSLNREKFENYIDILLKYGADPNQIHARFKSPPLRSAISSNDPIAVKKLIQAGADVDWQGNSGRSLVSDAAGRNAREILQLLLDQGADYRVIDKSNGLTAIHVLARHYPLMQDNSEFGHQYREIAAWLEKRGMSIERAREQREQWQNMDKSRGSKAAVAKFIKEVSEPEVARWLPPGAEPLELPEAVHRPNMQDTNVRVVAPNPVPPPPQPQNNVWDDVATIAMSVVLLLFVIGIALLFLYPYDKKKQ